MSPVRLAALVAAHLEREHAVRREHVGLGHLETELFHGREPRVRTRIRGERRADGDAAAEAEPQRGVEILFVVQPARRPIAPRRTGMQAVPHAEVDAGALEAAVARIQRDAEIAERPHRQTPDRLPAGCRGRSTAIGKSSPRGDGQRARVRVGLRGGGRRRAEHRHSPPALPLVAHRPGSRRHAHVCTSGRFRHQRNRGCGAPRCKRNATASEVRISGPARRFRARGGQTGGTPDPDIFVAIRRLSDNHVAWLSQGGLAPWSVTRRACEIARVRSDIFVSLNSRPYIYVARAAPRRPRKWRETA